MTGAAGPGPAVAVVTGAAGSAVTLDPGGDLVIGRSGECDLSFPDEPRLSRRALRVSGRDSGVLITNTSRTHGLLVTVAGASARLPRMRDGDTTGYFVSGGRASICAPAWADSSFRVVMDVDGRWNPDSRADSRAWQRDRLTATQEPWRLDPRTKEFVTALMLCRDRLTHPSSSRPAPAVPLLTHQILEQMNCHHLLREMDVDEDARRRLTGRVHEHIKALRDKVRRRRLVGDGTSITPTLLVDLLTATETINGSHLALLDDPVWLVHQERQWWGE